MFKKKKEKLKNKCVFKNINIYAYKIKKKGREKKERNLSIDLFFGFIANVGISAQGDVDYLNYKKTFTCLFGHFYENIVTNINYLQKRKKQKENDDGKQHFFRRIKYW